jgi:hypothetical protein
MRNACITWYYASVRVCIYMCVYIYIDAIDAIYIYIYVYIQTHYLIFHLDTYICIYISVYTYVCIYDSGCRCSPRARRADVILFAYCSWCSGFICAYYLFVSRYIPYGIDIFSVSCLAFPYSCIRIFHTSCNAKKKQVKKKKLEAGNRRVIRPPSPCPHAAIYVSSNYYWFVHILLYVSSYCYVSCRTATLSLARARARARALSLYHTTHTQVLWFWQIMRAMTLDQRSMVLQFVTGNERPPLTGFQALEYPFTVQAIRSA